MNLLKKPIELLLEDGHDDVVWGEPIAGVTELKKRINNMPVPTSIEGYITVRFSDPVSRDKLFNLLKKDEYIQDGSEGKLTMGGYTPKSLHVEKTEENSMRSIITFNEYGANLAIHSEGKKNTVDARAIEILDAYLALVIQAKEWVVR